jgi:hypothetical protein
MTRTRSAPASFLALASFLVLALPASAIPIAWTEGADAGDLPADADLVVAPVDVIVGSLDVFGDDLVDTFRIFIPNASTFSARTGPFGFLGQLADPVMYLFDSLGNGVYMDDDGDIDGNAQSALGPLPVGYGSGFYFLSIAFSGVEPIDSFGSSIFDAFGTLALDPGAGAVADYFGTPLSPDFDLPGSYEISVTLRVPEPGTAALMLAGLLVLASVGVPTRKSKSLLG